MMSFSEAAASEMCLMEKEMLIKAIERKSVLLKYMWKGC